MSNYNIYPKQFRNARIAIEKNRCFVLMPFDKQYDLIYGQMKKYLQDAGYVCNRADELFGSVPIMNNIIKEILKSHFVIADLTMQNANVFYELGIAHSFKDAHNIVLLAQSVNDIPFDIRHLSTIIYAPDNPRHLNASILQTIKENSHQYGFYEALQSKGVLSLISDNTDDFIGDLVSSLHSKITCLTDLLNGEADSIPDSEVKDALESFLTFLYLPTTCASRKNLRNAVHILTAILCQSERFSFAHEVVKHFIYSNKLENFSVGESEIVYMQSSLATGLARENRYFDIVMPWIIHYFSKSKSASVDLNRYGMEEFLLTSDHNEVNTVIINSLLHDNCYVREHMADMVGEKKLLAGLSSLLAQLNREENIYATSSIITALGKLGDKKAYGHILKWLKKNEAKIMSTEHFFILKHIYVALASIDGKNQKTTDFLKKYEQHISLEFMS